MNIQMRSGNIFKQVNSQIAAIFIDAGMAVPAPSPASKGGEPSYADVKSCVLMHFQTRPAAQLAYAVVAYDLKPSSTFMQKKQPSDGSNLFECWVRSALKNLP